MGRWNWITTLEPGAGYSARTRAGQEWIATNTANQIVRQMVAVLGSSRVKVK